MSAGRGTCRSCMHYEALKRECRRNAPHIFMVPGPRGEPVFLGAFPPARDELWCGEYKFGIDLAAAGKA